MKNDLQYYMCIVVPPKVKIRLVWNDRLLGEKKSPTIYIHAFFSERVL